MNEADAVKYYRKIIHFQDYFIDSISRGQLTSINSLCKLLDITKFNDKNLIETVKFFIDIGIFIYDTDHYIITKESKVKAREMLESLDIYNDFESMYDIIRVKQKGTEI